MKNNKPILTAEEKLQKMKAFMAQPENREIAEAEFERIMKAVLIQRIKEIRKAKNLSQEDMAKMMGVKQPEIARLEKGETSPNFKTIFKFLFAINGRFEIIY